VGNVFVKNVRLEVNRDIVGVCRVCYTEELWVSEGVERNRMEWNRWGIMFF
jgi:hypothetical protein